MTLRLPVLPFVKSNPSDHRVIPSGIFWRGRGKGLPGPRARCALNRRGKTIKCRVGCTLGIGPQRQRRGAVLLMEEIAQ